MSNTATCHWSTQRRRPTRAPGLSHSSLGRGFASGPIGAPTSNSPEVAASSSVGSSESSPPWYEVSVDGPDVIMSFPGFAMFAFSPSTEVIRGYPERDTTALTMSHLLLDQVMPLLLAGTGHHVLHASAVSVDTRQTRLRRWSSWATQAPGSPAPPTPPPRSELSFLADDFVIVAISDGRPSSRSALTNAESRLWDESVCGLQPAPLSERVSQHNSKRRVRSDVRDQRRDSLPVLAVLALGEARPFGHGSDARADAASGHHDAPAPPLFSTRSNGSAGARVRRWTPRRDSPRVCRGSRFGCRLICPVCAPHAASSSMRSLRPRSEASYAAAALIRSDGLGQRAWRRSDRPAPRVRRGGPASTIRPSWSTYTMSVLRVAVSL